MNAILDGYPEEYKGYLIRTDFRIGMQISQCLSDDELDEGEKITTALMLLFGNGIPEIEVAMSGLSWYLNAGAEPKNKETDVETSDEEEAFFDFEVDSERIITAFKRFYHIDITKENIHWFQFLSMLSDVGECAFSKIVGYRAMDLSEMTGKQKNTYAKLKSRYALGKKYTEDEQERINEFLAELQ